MASTGVVDLFVVYQFIKRLATPFNKWDAYKTGVIDERGNILIKPGMRDKPQLDSSQNSIFVNRDGSPPALKP